MATSLGALLARVERQMAGRSAGDAPAEMPPRRPACDLPPRHHCTTRWHWREDQGNGTAYERCPHFVAARRAAVAAEVPGEQTFESFHRLHEPEGFEAARRWVLACRSGGARLALIRSAGKSQNTGCGKTHLLRAAARELARSGSWVEMVPAWDLTAAIRGRARFDAVERSSAEIAAKRWIACDVLILDDLGQEEVAGPAAASFLVGLLEARRHGGLAVASNLSEAELTSRYGPPLVSRLLGGAQAPALRGIDFRRSRRGGEGA